MLETSISAFSKDIYKAPIYKELLFNPLPHNPDF